MTRTPVLLPVLSQQQHLLMLSLLGQQVGGAYGGFSDFDSHSGMYTYLSYRDPNVLKTVESYDGTPDFLRSLELDSDSLTKAIIGTIGDIDSYQLPDSKVHHAVGRLP